MCLVNRILDQQQEIRDKVNNAASTKSPTDALEQQTQQSLLRHQMKIHEQLPNLIYLTVYNQVKLETTTAIIHPDRRHTSISGLKASVCFE